MRLRAAEERDSRAVGREARKEIVAEVGLGARQRALLARCQRARDEASGELRAHGTDIHQRRAVRGNVEAGLRRARAIDEALPCAGRKIERDDFAVPVRRSAIERDAPAVGKEDGRQVELLAVAENRACGRSHVAQDDLRAPAFAGRERYLPSVRREARRDFELDARREGLRARELARELRPVDRRPGRRQQHHDQCNDGRGCRHTGDDPAQTAVPSRCGRARPRRRHRRDQPVADLGQGLDVASLAGVVAQRDAQVRDDAGEDVVVHHPARPRVGKQGLARHHLPGRGGEPQQHVHEPGLDADEGAGDDELVGGRPHFHLRHPEGRPFPPRKVSCHARRRNKGDGNQDVRGLARSRSTSRLHPRFRGSSCRGSLSWPPRSCWRRPPPTRSPRAGTGCSSAAISAPSTYSTPAPAPTCAISTRAPASAARRPSSSAPTASST